MKMKTFDCIEMKRQGALRIHSRLEGMNLEEQIDYWHRRSEQFRREQERLLKKNEQAMVGDRPEET